MIRRCRCGLEGTSPTVSLCVTATLREAGLLLPPAHSRSARAFGAGDQTSVASWFRAGLRVTLDGMGRMRGAAEDTPVFREGGHGRGSGRSYPRIIFLPAIFWAIGLIRRQTWRRRRRDRLGGARWQRRAGYGGQP
jgi:hypothetical protein